MSKDLLTLPRPESHSALEEYSQNPLGFMTRCANEFGEIVPLQLDGELRCLLTNPDHITEVLKDRLSFIKGQETRLLQEFLGNGLVVSEGDFWQRQRRLIHPVFHQQRIGSYGAVMVDYTQRLLQTWHEGKVLDVHEEMMYLTLNIVMKTIFNRDISSGESRNVADALEEAMIWFAVQTTGKEASSKSDRRYQEAIALLDETVYAIISHRRTIESAGEDLLGMLMQVQDADDGSRMTDRQLRDEVATMILAGHETTANTLSWAWLLLAQHPQVRDELTQELKTVLNGRTPTLADVPQLHYTEMVIKEVMRFYPTVTDINREAIQDCQVGGYLIPKGTTLVVSQWVMHRNPKYFTAPDTFNPQRWANDLEKQLPRGVYFPFGDGPRVCIGKAFAKMELVLLLATIAQAFQLYLLPNHNIELQPSITLRPKHGIQVMLKKV